MEALGSALLSVAGAIGLNDELLARYGVRFLEGLWVTSRSSSSPCSSGH